MAASQKKCFDSASKFRFLIIYKVRKVSKISQEPRNVRSKHDKWNIAVM